MIEGGVTSVKEIPAEEMVSDVCEKPWVEKYRPTDLKDIVGNKEIISRLKAIAEQGNMPNLILSGAPGIGKTTSMVCLAKSLLGSAFKDAVLELNASDDRGIDVVREKIKMFAQKKVILPPGRHKIIILDEADSITKGAQQALRRTIELHSGTTRFAFACNQSDKIIEAIQSRCAIVRFQTLGDKDILARLLEVAKAENVQYTDDGMEAIVFTAQGDMRRGLNNLQSTSTGFQLVTAENVFKVCDQPHPLVVKRIIEHCLQGDIDAAIAELSGLWDEGYAALDIMATVFRVVKNYSMPEYLKLEFLKEIGLTQAVAADGVSSLLQLDGMLARLCQVQAESSLTQR
jgi:replication factor C subunit 2/4